ncbi:TPA: hypothetical protein DCW38_07360 [candidate division WOR-3 bacterium]|uniref:MotA/TolQ/ExbB proton channel domain-containing protein n=1 Tax=candidate division WOR-3 bacterium TaxID=2052148 RepID=A0A350HBR1_UNCW3|nr:hypothetical protein [candidate division WOR-3 bacterium]
MAKKITSILLIVAISSSIFTNAREITNNNVESYTDGDKNSVDEDSTMLKELEQNPDIMLIILPGKIDIADRDTLLTSQILRDMVDAKPENKVMNALLAGGVVATAIDGFTVLMITLVAIASNFSDGSTDQLLQEIKRDFLVMNIIASSIIVIAGIGYTLLNRFLK